MAGYDYSKDFLRRSGRSSTAPTGEAVLFGKHPAWNDHMPVLGTATADLAAVKELLYDGGVGAILDDPELHWDRLPAEKCLPAFNHLFLWQRRGQLVAGALWGTSDGAGRRQYPLILAAQCSFAVGTDAAPLLEHLQAARSDFLGEDEATLRQTVAAVQRDDGLRAELARKTQKAVAGLQVALAHLPLEPLACAVPERLARCGQTEGVGLLRVVSRVQTLLKRARSDTSGLRFRADSVANPLNGLSNWLDLLRTFVPEEMPILLIQPNGQPWVDVILGRPGPDDLRCLKLNLAGLTTEQSIEADLDDNERCAAENVVRTYLKRPAESLLGARSQGQTEGFWSQRLELFPKWLLFAAPVLFVIGVLAVVFLRPSDPAGKTDRLVAATNRAVTSPTSGLPTTPPSSPIVPPTPPESLSVNRASGGVDIETGSPRVEIRHEAQDGKKHANPRFAFGRLTLSELSPGQHSFSMSEPGFEPLSTNVAIEAGSTKRLLVRLTPLAGRVVVENLMAKSSVQADNGTTNLAFPPVTGTGVTAANLPAGTWRLLINQDHELFGRAETNLTVTASSQQPVRVEVPRPIFPLGALQVSMPGGFERMWLDQRKILGGQEVTGLLPAKAYSVVIEVRGYRPFTNRELVQIAAGRKSVLALVPEQLTPLPATLTMTVQPAFATTTLRSSPSGAVVSRLGMESGALRQTTNLSIGAYIFEASADGLDPRSLRLHLGPGASVNSNLTLEFGAIRLAVEPAEARVRVDDRMLNPGQNLIHLKPRATTIEASLPGFQTVRSNVTVAMGQTNLFRLQLKEEPVSVSTTPGAARPQHVEKEFGGMAFIWVQDAPGGGHWPGQRGVGIWVGKFEVTRAQFDSVLPARAALVGPTKSPKSPITDISRQELAQFEERLTRLVEQKEQLIGQISVTIPTLVQWRHFCGAPNHKQMVTSLGSRWLEESPKEVGSRPPNERGLHDVFGNVAELAWKTRRGEELVWIGGNHYTISHNELENPREFAGKSVVVGFRCVILPKAKQAD